MKRIPGGRGGFINVLEKGETANPGGKARKFITQIKDAGYKAAEVRACILVFLSMTQEEIKAAANAPSLTLLERIVIKALLNDEKRGTVANLEVLLSRAHGKPREQIDINSNTLTVQKIIVEHVEIKSNE